MFSSWQSYRNTPRTTNFPRLAEHFRESRRTGEQGQYRDVLLVLRVQRLTQLVGGGDNVSGDTRVQIGVHDAERVQLGHMVPSDLQGVTTAQSPPRTGGAGGDGGEGVDRAKWRPGWRRGGGGGWNKTQRKRRVDEKQDGVEGTPK